MKNYQHYGVEVTKQVIDTPFIDTLRKNDVDFIELPFISHQVIKYAKDEKNKYALIVPLNMPNDYAETVYIMDSIPDDADWEKLISDIADQSEGKTPLQLPSRLKVLIDGAYNEIIKTMPATNDVFNDSTHISEEVIVKEISLILSNKGYNRYELENTDTHDIDKEFLSKLINA